MIKTKYLFISLICLALINCKTEENNIPLDKRYWDINDYEKVILELSYGYKDDEEKPRFDNPQQRIIVEKLTDEQNFKVVLNDNELGLNHRNSMANAFFDKWKDMHKIYQETDRKDNYVYDIEMLAVWHFGLSLQQEYFKLGNDQIKENADDPNSSQVINNVNSNIQIQINNYIIYLDEINNERSYSEKGKLKLAKGIDKYFIQLINIYPDADYTRMKDKAELMIKKSKSDKIKNSLEKMIKLIESKEKKE